MNCFLPHSLRLRHSLPLLLVGALCCWALLGALPRPAAAASASLADQIRQEQDKAAARRSSLQRLSAEERRLNTDLALSEDRILKLEASLADQARTLDDLARSDSQLQERAAELALERESSEQVLADLTRALWEIYSRREGVGGRDLPDWHVTDREHNWSLALLRSMGEYRKLLLEQSAQLDAIGREREAVARSAAEKFASLEREKEELLQTRLSHSRRLQELRKQQRDTEAELDAILALVTSLNLQLKASETRSAIEKSKGSLPRPVEGSIALRFNLGANPPQRGVSFSVREGLDVRAVHWGKVVHNDIVRGKGRVVILMHGDAYYTLYAYLADSALRVGQELDRHDVIGKAGFIPEINGPGVYFELRFHQKAINPEDWFSKK